MVRNVSDEKIEVKFDTMCSQQEQTYYININDILKTYSAYTVYPEGILQKYNIRALDIQYKLIPFYSGRVLTYFTYRMPINQITYYYHGFGISILNVWFSKLCKI